jgi:phosphohistidine phosphatase
MGEFIAFHTIVRVNCIMHSGKTRARQTAEALAGCFSPKDGIREVSGLRPLDNPNIWVDRLKERDEDVMLVGHLPHLGKLATILLCGPDDKSSVDFQTGGIVCMARDEYGCWSISWSFCPKLIS